MKTKNILLLLMLTMISITYGTIQAQSTICAGEELCLTVTARGDIQWQQSPTGASFANIGGAIGDTACIFPIQDMYYRAIVLEGTCDSVISDTQFVAVLPGLVADAGADIDLCEGDSATIGGSPAVAGGTAPYVYNWTPAAGLSSSTASNPMAFPSITTMYVLTVTDANGCMGSDTMTVFVNSSPIADAGMDLTTNCTTAVQIGGSPTGSGGSGTLSYLWTPSSGITTPTSANPMALPSVTSTLTVTVTDSLGCSGADDMVLTVLGSASGVDTVNFTGAPVMWIVQPCMDSLFIQVWGAQGGFDPPTAGGLGGYAQGYLTPNVGDTLWLYVGGKGTDGPGSGQNCNLLGGWNGGGNTGATCCSNSGGGAGAGGGGTDVRLGGQTLNDRVIVGGGGGGAGSNNVGAAGGGLVGSNGGAYNGVPSTGGSQTAGGNKGGYFTSHTCSEATNGAFGQGGIGDGNDGGGAGGGWYGGGGGANNNGGAGGSSYYGGVVNGSTTGGIRSGDGLIIITW